MVQINQKNRYPSAGAAKIALQKIDIKNIPVVELNLPSLNFTSTQIDEKLTQIISVKSYISNDVKTGTWEIAKHPNDQANSGNNHPWILITPSKFSLQRNEYKITVDTSKLMAEETYERQIILRANSTPKINYFFTIKVQTAPIILQHTNNPLIRFFNRWISPQLEAEKITLALTHSGTPTWSDKDFQNLLQTLASAGYGWLEPEEVNQQLQDMIKNRQFHQLNSTIENTDISSEIK